MQIQLKTFKNNRLRKLIRCCRCIKSLARHGCRHQVRVMLNSVPLDVLSLCFLVSILLFIRTLSVSPLSIFLMCPCGGLVHWAKLVFMGVEGDIPADCMLNHTSKDFVHYKDTKCCYCYFDSGNCSVYIVILVCS